MAIVLNLFSDSVWQALTKVDASRIDSVSSLRSDACIPQPLRAKDYCNGCEYYGLCDSDECAKKCYPIDSPFEFSHFPNLGVYVDFLKHHGWL